MRVITALRSCAGVRRHDNETCKGSSFSSRNPEPRFKFVRGSVYFLCNLAINQALSVILRLNSYLLSPRVSNPATLAGDADRLHGEV